MAGLVVERDPIAADDEEQEQIDALASLLDGDAAGAPVLLGPGGDRVTLPESLLRVLRRAVKALAHHNAVAIVPIQKLLTTNEAADLLNVSRPYLIRLIDRGDLPHTRVGSHRRISFADLMSYKQIRDSMRRESLRELTRMNQEFGLYERH